MMIESAVIQAMQDLRYDGMTYRGIAKAIGILYKITITHNTVRYHLDKRYRNEDNARSNRNYHKRQCDKLNDLPSKLTEDEKLEKLFPWTK